MRAPWSNIAPRCAQKTGLEHEREKIQDPATRTVKPGGSSEAVEEERMGLGTNNGAVWPQVYQRVINLCLFRTSFWNSALFIAGPLQVGLLSGACHWLPD